MAEKTENMKSEVKLKYSLRKIARNGFIIIIAITLGYLHYKYVSTLFENDRNFSHLSELEREMSLRTEMGFYYSFYKTVVQERPFIAGISKLMYDRHVEHPKEVNAFNRFNIYPEVIIGGIYRYFEPWLNTTAHRTCHMVHRGDGLSPVQSCIGIGEPVLFYLEGVWILAAVMVAAVFLNGAMLSETILGGLLAVAQYFANHSECTRVQWAPNERENFAAPLLFLQAWLTTAQLRDRERRTSFHLQVSLFILNCLCLLFWQFSQFIFLTQTAIFFLMEQLRIIEIKTLCVFLHSHFCGLHMAVLLLQGNDMLKSSLYSSFFLVVSVYCLFFSSLRVKVRNCGDFFVETWLVILRVSIVLLSSIYLKKIISDFLNVDEDSHVWEILYSKFTNYKSFHTLIYTCSDVFNYLPWSTVKNVTYTCLIPMVIFSCINATIHWIRKALRDVDQYYENGKAETVNEIAETANGAAEFRNCAAEVENENAERKNEKAELEADANDDTDDSGIENNTDTVKLIKDDARKDLDLIETVAKPNVEEKEEFIDDILICFLKCLRMDAAIVYNVAQMVVFGAMATLVMRLKLLFVTQMCVVSSLVMNVKYFKNPKSKWIPLAGGVAIGILLNRLYVNVSLEMAHIGEFSDYSSEELLQWAASSGGGAFAGSLPVLAAVLLAARRPVVAHPHYEHRDARDRAYAVFKMYGRFSPQELYQELTKLQASYLIVERKYCYGRSPTGCSFLEIWDIEAPSYIGRPKLCHTLLTEPTDHFYMVFSNSEYAVFRVHDMSVRYMPRCFDT